MNEFEKAKQKVLSLIKMGQLSKENAQQALAIYRGLHEKGKKVSIEFVLQKKGFIKQEASDSRAVSEDLAKKPQKKKSGKVAKKKVKKPQKKLLSVDEEGENKFAKRRKKSNKRPALIGIAVLLVTLSIAFLLFRKADLDKAEHAEKQRLKREKMKKETGK